MLTGRIPRITEVQVPTVQPEPTGRHLQAQEILTREVLLPEAAARVTTAGLHLLQGVIHQVAQAVPEVQEAAQEDRLLHLQAEGKRTI